MNLKELKNEALRLIDAYPTKSDEIREYYFLAVSEIEEGGSEVHECDLAWRDMLESIEDLEM